MARFVRGAFVLFGFPMMDLVSVLRLSYIPLDWNSLLDFVRALSLETADSSASLLRFSPFPYFSFDFLPALIGITVALGLPRYGFYLSPRQSCDEFFARTHSFLKKTRTLSSFNPYRIENVLLITRTFPDLDFHSIHVSYHRHR